MVCDVPLEAVYDSRGVVEISTDIGRRDLSANAGEVDSMPLNKLVLSTMVVVVL